MFVPQKLYGVIGDPIAHSLSPLLHNTAFQAWGIPAALFAWRIARASLPDFVRAARLLPIAGACVTIPHKEAILPLLDRITPLAQKVGAVNTLYWDDGELVGHNTDVEGFLAPLRTRPTSGPASEPPFTRALVLGAGGAARAVLAGLMSLKGVESVQVAARRIEQAEALIAGVKPAEEKSGPQPTVTALAWEERHSASADLVVNTTPLGLGERDALPLDSFPGQKGLAYDLIYRDTPFLAAARAAGWKALNGRDMFVAQAAAQFILWTGFPLPESALSALDEALHI